MEEESQMLTQLRAQFISKRTKAKISKVNLERLTNTGGGSVGNFEDGTTNVTVAKLVKWCEHLGLEIVIRKRKQIKNEKSI